MIPGQMMRKLSQITYLINSMPIINYSFWTSSDGVSRFILGKDSFLWMLLKSDWVNLTWNQYYVG